MWKMIGPALLVVLSVVAVACGTSTDVTSDVASLEEGGADDQAVSVLTEIVDLEQDLFEFSACMRDQDVDIGDPTVDADGNVALGKPMGADSFSDHGALMAAYEACSDFIGGRALSMGGADETTVHDRLFEFARCVRENGYDIVDPDFSSAGGDIFPGLDQDDPDYEAAQGVCEDLLVDTGGDG